MPSPKSTKDDRGAAAVTVLEPERPTTLTETPMSLPSMKVLVRTTPLIGDSINLALPGDVRPCITSTR